MNEIALPDGFVASVTKTQCPTCNKEYEVKPNAEGRKATCKGCGLSFVISHLYEVPSREYLAFTAGMEAMRAHIVQQLEQQALEEQRQAQVQEAQLVEAQTNYLNASRKQGWVHAGAVAGIAAAILGVDFSD